MIQRLKAFVLRQMLGKDYGFKVVGPFRVVRRDRDCYNNFWVTISTGPLGTRIHFNEPTRIHLRKPLRIETPIHTRVVTHFNIEAGTQLYFDKNLFPEGTLKNRVGTKKIKEIIEYIALAKEHSELRQQYEITEKRLNEFRS